MSRAFSRASFFFVFVGLFLLVPPFTDQAIDFLSSNVFIFLGFFLYMIGAILTAVSVYKGERNVLVVVNILGILGGIFFIFMLSTALGV
ncbi:MAG: hypothetical protein ACRC0Q_13935 [Kurthia gibsonii]|uniref:Uncharacterized protein n=1 Tax=Kurthia gibsonii TaxID=33946 RepID=A0ABU9LNV3_9BACL|nr:MULTISPECIES: hypothetical protein [Kurthia]MCA9725216.1 hypothetical protein [Kurthia sp.]AMA64160.1 putative membrane protein [Kurthia sp. 11kri321]MEB6112163.1 hypothetical protein [Kurthia gibsonii]MEB7771154.1 hypothetical protein [Kurthia gibsonii]RXH51080.1 hypothetical protein D6T70_13490 [Kurthia gibsonii]